MSRLPFLPLALVAQRSFRGPCLAGQCHRTQASGLNPCGWAVRSSGREQFRLFCLLENAAPRSCDSANSLGRRLPSSPGCRNVG